MEASLGELYRMSYKFNASHNTGTDENGGHVHTFRLLIVLRRVTQGYVDFYDYENKVKNLIARYRGKSFNDFEEFSRITPTIENIGIYFYNTLGRMFEEDGMLHLMQVELGDSPTQSFAVSEDYVISDVNRTMTREKLLQLIGV